MPSLPQYLMGIQGQLDFEPINQGLGRYFQRQQMDIENQRQAERMAMEQQRLGFEGERLGFERARQPYELAGLDARTKAAQAELGLIPGRRAMQNEEIAAARQRREQSAEMHPLELAAKRKAVEGQKYGAFKEGEMPYVVDPTAPGGIRFLSLPEGAGPAQKKFNEKAAETVADRYATIAKHGDAQPEMRFNLQRLQDLSTMIGAPNAKTQIAVKFGPALKAMGVDPKNMSDIEMFSSLISKMAPNLRPPGSGATSDFDLQQYINSLPQIVQTVAGRKMLIQHLAAVSQYSEAQAQIAKRALLGKITREQAEIELENLPDPHAIWRQATGTKPAPAEAQQPTGVQPERAVRVRTPEEARKLPSGTTIILPDGSMGRVP